MNNIKCDCDLDINLEEFNKLSSIQFKEIFNDSGRWELYSDEINYSDWNAVFIIEIIDMDEFNDNIEDEERFSLSLKVTNIRPYKFNMKARVKLLEQDFEKETAEEYAKSKDWYHIVAEMLSINVGSANLVSVCGSTPQETLMKLVNDTKNYKKKIGPYEGIHVTGEELQSGETTNINVITSMIGFFLDAPQNRFGATGWEFMEGDVTGQAFRDYMYDKDKERINELCNNIRPWLNPIGETKFKLSKDLKTMTISTHYKKPLQVKLDLFDLHKGKVRTL